MRSESELVPYAPGRLDGSPVLVLAPHPDDEVFGCGGVMVQAVRSGARLRVVVLTDGDAQGDPGERRQESRAAARRLGLPEPEFWGLADRTLRSDDPSLGQRLRELVVATGPRVVLVPSTAEIHPDHRAVTLLVYRILQGAEPGGDLHAAIQGVRLAAYESSAVLRPNLIVDVTGEWQEVLAAAGSFASQNRLLPYLEVLDARATARRLTMPPLVRRAEAFHVVDLRFIRTHSASEWAAAQGPSAELEEPGDAARLDVVIRTRNRPQLLREALASVAGQHHPPGRVIVINDGGVSVSDLCAEWRERLGLDLVELAGSRGRSAAAQLGLERAGAGHVVFLDDDDLMLPEHLLALGRAVARGATVPYVDAVQGVYASDGAGGFTPVARHRTFTGGFDTDRLRLTNYIPLPTVAVPRQLALEVGGFDPQLDLYEDWDLLLRLAARTPFVHVPQVTCEYRVMPEGASITGSSPPGSPGQLAALQGIWRRNGLLDDAGRMASAVMALVAERDRAAERARLLDEQLLESRGEADGLRAEVVRRRAECDRLALEAERAAAGERARLEGEVAPLVAQAGELRTEIARLNGILDTIYASKTWRLHTAVDRVRRFLRRS